MTALIARAKAALIARRQYKATVKELRALTDRELRDLGISRFDITRIAREAVYA